MGLLLHFSDFILNNQFSSAGVGPINKTMKSSTVLVMSALMLLALFSSSSQNAEAALLDDFLISAEKATSFIQGAHAAPDTAAEIAAEAAEPKDPAEASRELAKTPDEVADG